MAANADMALRLQALEQAQPGGQAPTGPANTRPDAFGGNRTEDVRRWLDRFQLHREANGWNDARARSMMAVSLTGPAENWFHAQADDQVDTIEHITESLRTAFAPVDDSLALRDQLMSRRQGQTESVEAYGADILELCRHLDRNMAGREKCAYLLHGLREALKEHVLTQHPGTDNVANVLQTARIKEQAMRTITPPASGVHAATYDTNDATFRELAQDMRRVLNRLDSISDRLSTVERRTETGTTNNYGRDRRDGRDRHDGRDRRGQSGAWGNWPQGHDDGRNGGAMPASGPRAPPPQGQHPFPGQHLSAHNSFSGRQSNDARVDGRPLNR